MTVDVIGRSCVAPGADSIEALLQLLREGRCTVSEIPAERWNKARFWHPTAGVRGKAYTFAAGVLDDIYSFDPAVFGLSKREAIYMDPQQRVLLLLVWRALEDSALSIEALQNERVGVYIGASSLDNGNLYSEDPASGSPYFMTGNTLSIVANRISHIFGLQGPSMTIDTACSSSLVALDQAVRALENGDIDTAIVGGINILTHPYAFIGFSQARMLSTEGLCRAYGEGGQGYVRAEGGGAIVLRRSADVAGRGDRSYAQIVATGVNSAGRTNGISLPSREAQAALLQSIYDSAAIDPNSIAFVEGHGTGTKVGDPAEVWALGTVLGQRRSAPLPIGSIKSNIGHMEPASGILGLLKAMLSLQHDFVPASLHAEKPNEAIDFEGLNIRVNTSATSLLRGKGKRLAGVNSFGFGGTNVHVVISDPEPRAGKNTVAPSRMFMVSAHTRSALDLLLKEYGDRLENAGRRDGERMVGVSAGNRMALKHRFTVPSNDPDIVRAAIAARLAGDDQGLGEIGEAPPRSATLAFVYAGNGSQWAGMGVAAYEKNARFRERFDVFSDLFETHLSLSLSTLLRDELLADVLSDTKLAQPLLFAIQAALSDCFAAEGIVPSAVYGHSVGEIAAAYAAGILDAADAVAIVAIRSRHQDLLAGEGTMAAVAMSKTAAADFAHAHGLDDICVAAVNAQNSVTISGPKEQVQKFRDEAKRAHVVAHVLDINYPFHHPVIDRAKDAFLKDLPAIAPKEGTIPFISTVTGEVVAGSELDSRYWWRNVRDPVLFQAGTQKALEIGCNVFVEISPRPILASYISDAARQGSLLATPIATLIRSKTPETTDPVARTIARTVAYGAKSEILLDPACRDAGVDLPALPFELTELRPQPTSDRVDIYGRDSTVPYGLLGWQTDPNSSNWKNHLDRNLFPDLAEHVVDGKPIMPGSGYIEIAVTAAQRFFGTDDVEITNLEILRPLDLHESRLSELSTVISPETGLIEIRSREYLSEDEWSVHAVARSRKPVKAMAALTADFRNVTAMATVGADDAYATARQFGLDYGPHFRLLFAATAYGKRFVNVELKPAAPPSHPCLHYSLNPVSVDAAFHGLVALFGELTGEQGGAPYIPVRFGSIRTAANGQDIRRAVIEIERFSGNSIKAKFSFFDADGALVAAFEDCRFRRTYLRKHSSIDTASFHYEAVSSARNGRTASIPAVIAQSEPEDASDAALLLDAAVYRACHDVALAFAGADGRIVLQDVPGPHAFKCFVASCLCTLEDAQIGEADEDGWRVPARTSLPPVAEILTRIYREHPQHTAEAVLINDAHIQAHQWIDLVKTGAETGEFPPLLMSEATLDHYNIHSASSRLRMDLVLAAVEKVLASGRRGLRLMEIGTLSTGFTARLASAAERAGATLAIVEPQENLRKGLEIALEERANVVVTAGGDALPAADLIVSASGRLFELLKDDGDLRTAVKAQAQGGTHLVAAERAPSAYADFVFGLTPGWFADSPAADFPAGLIAPAAQWESLGKNLGFQQVTALQQDFADAGVILFEGISTPAGTAGMPPLHPADATPVLLLHAADEIARRLPDILPVPLMLDPDANRETAASVLETAGSGPIRALYIVEEETSAPSAALQDHVLRLSAFAEGLSHLDAGNLAPGERPRLVVVAPGGAPVAGVRFQPVATGLWTFARVLQNEYDFLEVHLLDADAGSEAGLQAIGALLREGGENREWSLDEASGLLSEIRAVRGPLARTGSTTKDFDAATITQKTPGRIDSIVWEEATQPSPAAGEVVIAVSATGLNFRDVMWAMGLLPEEALEDGFAGATIGMEFSGTVTAVGQGVGDVAPGDRVMGIASAAFSTHVVVSRAGITKVPESVDLVAAATVPVVFLTAYYAMVELGRIQAGETILIHGAAGGVGLAALQIAKLKGATVIATAGSLEKRAFLEMLGADHVFDSRSLDFVDQVLDVTHGEGVDLVLNSLFAEAMERSIELVKPFGRFLELGKRDYYSDRKIGLRPFRRNISYFGIDADQLLVKVPAVTERIFTEIGGLFASGALSPLPYRAFGHDEIANAFRLMQNAGHIGKIVVTPPVRGIDHVSQRPSRGLALSGGVHLVVGGIGGFGLAAANWLASLGAGHIALCTRRGLADADTVKAMKLWEKQGITASLHACDVTDEAAAADLLATLRQIGPLKGIVHAAMVLDDALIGNLDRERNRKVIDTKVKGADVLDRLTRGDALDLFLLFSSATTMVGNPGQANYVAANGYLEGLARARRKAGLPGLAIGFGAIADTGFLARNTDVGDILAKRIGKTALKAREALNLVQDYMVRASVTDPNEAVVMISELDWAAAGSLAIAKQPLFRAIALQAGYHTAGGDGEQLDLAALVAGKGPADAQAALHGVLAAEIAAILRVAEDTITPDKVLKDIGLDSLMAMELGLGLQQKTGFDIPLNGLNDGTTVADVVRKLYEKVTRTGQTSGDDGTAADSVIDDLAGKHVATDTRLTAGMTDQDGYGR